MIGNMDWWREGWIIRNGGLPFWCSEGSLGVFAVFSCCSQLGATSSHSEVSRGCSKGNDKNPKRKLQSQNQNRRVESLRLLSTWCEWKRVIVFLILNCTISYYDHCNTRWPTSHLVSSWLGSTVKGWVSARNSISCGNGKIRSVSIYWYCQFRGVLTINVVIWFRCGIKVLHRPHFQPKSKLLLPTASM